jgi:hypothetical protein
MPLADLNVPPYDAEVPREVRSFLREAGRRIERFHRPGRIPGFVPCDFEGAYNVLQRLADSGLARGNLLCEWGSGFGIVTCLAAMLEFDASGVEIERELVGEARRLAAHFELPVEFVCGSFIPPGHPAEADDFAWLSTDAAGEMDLAPDDLDVVFAYPWPDEEHFIRDLFERHCAAGAVLVTYHGGEAFRMCRKTA